jgi:hypothetical protein
MEKDMEKIETVSLLLVNIHGSEIVDEMVVLKIQIITL